MRITGGEFKGIRFSPPAKSWPTRPTTDIAKEALYNILTNRLYFEDVRFLDLYGGTGSHCYECISRGCPEATYIDKFGPAVKFVRQMAEKLGIKDKMIIRQMDVFKFIESTEEKYDFIFAGPPYASNQIEAIPKRIFAKNLLHSHGLLVVEHNPNVRMDGLRNFAEQRNYGKTMFSFFQLTFPAVPHE